MASKLDKGSVATRNSAIVSVFLFILKLSGGLLTNSIVLLSDALDSGFDILTMIASWFGFKIAKRKPDEKFPYGYYKAESIISLFVSLLIIYAAINLIIEGFGHENLNKTYIWFALLSSGASVITSFFLSKYLLSQGKKINSQLLINNGKERLSDCIKSSSVFISLLLANHYLETIITIVISLIILKVGIESVKNSIFSLMDISPSKSVEKNVRRNILAIPEVKSISSLKLRKSGPFVFGEVSVLLNENINIKKAHNIADLIEKTAGIDHIVVHIEPYKSNKLIAIPVDSNNGLNSKISNSFAKAKGFLIINVRNNKISFLENKYINKPIRAGPRVVDLLVKHNVDALIVRHIGEISFHKLRDMFIDIYKTNNKLVRTILKKFINNKLQKLLKPTKIK